jgi:hypothetical protein
MVDRICIDPTREMTAAHFSADGMICARRALREPIRDRTRIDDTPLVVLVRLVRSPSSIDVIVGTSHLHHARVDRMLAAAVAPPTRLASRSTKSP